MPFTGCIACTYLPYLPIFSISSSGFKDGWLVRSNRESGNGFSDIMIKIDDSDTGIIIEVKYSETNDLEMDCKKALRQVDETGYSEALHQEDVHKILKYGIACRRKDCRVILETEY